MSELRIIMADKETETESEIVICDDDGSNKITLEEGSKEQKINPKIMLIKLRNFLKETENPDLRFHWRFNQEINDGARLYFYLSNKDKKRLEVWYDHVNYHNYLKEELGFFPNPYEQYKSSRRLYLIDNENCTIDDRNYIIDSLEYFLNRCPFFYLAEIKEIIFDLVKNYFPDLGYLETRQKISSYLSERENKETSESKEIEKFINGKAMTLIDAEMKLVTAFCEKNADEATRFTKGYEYWSLRGLQLNKYGYNFTFPIFYQVLDLLNQEQCLKIYDRNLDKFFEYIDCIENYNNRKILRMHQKQKDKFEEFKFNQVRKAQKQTCLLFAKKLSMHPLGDANILGFTLEMAGDQIELKEPKIQDIQKSRV